MRRESARLKGLRLLLDGRLTVRHVQGEIVRAECKGDSGVLYSLGHFPSRGWECTCPARTTCSHLRALMSVVTVNGK